MLESSNLDIYYRSDLPVILGWPDTGLGEARLEGEPGARGADPNVAMATMSRTRRS